MVSQFHVPLEVHPVRTSHTRGRQLGGMRGGLDSYIGNHIGAILYQWETRANVLKRLHRIQPSVLRIFKKRSTFDSSSGQPCSRGRQTQQSDAHRTRDLSPVVRQT